ncbi:DUF3301 domain-containing protein [Denitromonas sp.]|uniref:DUF3301 domain-containing protein n=1 Tax=Denitromonas sp. TaxID=2734609 RepID=UPI002AFE5CEA|nr:DUF3301 domain-containing protein [Denitromonas sp.]
MITLWDILPVALLALMAWYWMDSLKAREAALHAARSACALRSFQFLDDTVATERTHFGRNGMGQVVLRRVYRFEFSDTGDNRRLGSVVMLGRQVEVVQLAGVLEVVK